MQIGDIDFPNELLSALEERRLVIFAGAGVSMAAPAGLPGFRGLVEEILGRPVPDSEVGQLDRVLGREKDRGVPVHQLAAERLTRPEARFNSLHEGLVRLFADPSALRIVTTNFDLFFECALGAAEQAPRAKVYNAPALPVGSSFSGLVHLHGSLDGDPEELVLTDADFGRAYLSEGWAGRFVLELFRHYDVLFVGYSYGDVVMSYLTRGLAPAFGRKRFALAPTGEREKWTLLGIEVLEYDPADGHRALPTSVARWATYARRGYLDWSQQLRRLVANPPEDMTPDAVGELDFCLRDPKRSRLFFAEARHSSWLEWVDRRGWLDPLFSLEGDSEGLRELALWFTEDPLGERGKVALQLALQPRRLSSRTLAVVATQQVHHALSTLPALTTEQAQRAAAWASLLVERAPSDTSLDQLGFWLEHLNPEHHSALIVQILAHLLRCQLLYQSPSYWEKDDPQGFSVETPLRTNHAGFTVGRARSQIRAAAALLVPVLTEILESRWRWRTSLRSDAARHDPWGWDRAWVERPPGEGRPDRGDDDGGARVLLEVGKEILDELLAAAPAKADATIELWLGAGSAQLTQLGLYGLARSCSHRPAAKLRRLLSAHLPAILPFKVEAFRVLAAAYPQISARQRGAFLKQAERLYRREIDRRQGDPDRRRSAVYEWYNLLVWLDRQAPGDPHLGRAFEAVRAEHPDFGPRDHPELDISGGRAVWVGAESPLSVEELARLTFEEWAAAFAKAAESRWTADLPTDRRRGFLEETARAASEDLAWGLGLGRRLIEGGQLDHEVWSGLLQAWADRSFSPEEWSQALALLSAEGLLRAQALGVARILEGRIQHQDPALTQDMLQLGLAVAARLLPLAEEAPFGLLNETEDWLAQAINHPGGSLARFLIHSISRLAGESAEAGCGIPEACRPLLEAMVVGHGRASAMARVILAADAHYLLWLAPEWTREKLLPSFDWSRDARTAFQAWHGLLCLGRPTARLMETLGPFAVQLAEHLEALGKEREHYGKFIARAAFAQPEDPLSKGWLRAFLERANDRDRAHFAWDLSKRLASLTEDQKAELWGDWLERFLIHRATYPPAPEGDELTALVGWAEHLPAQLAALVGRLEALPGRGAGNLRLVWKIAQGEVAGSDPTLLARLVRAILRRLDKVESWDLSSVREALERLIGEGADRAVTRELLEKYVELGGGRYEELLALLEPEPASRPPT